MDEGKALHARSGHDHDKALAVLHEGTVIPATPLALTDARTFDEQIQRRLMRYYLDCGVGGIATAVHSTQFAIRNPEVGLFEPILRVVSEEIDRYEARTGKTIVKVCGVCGKIEQAKAESRLAKEAGYDAVLLSPGGLSECSEDYLIERTHAVAKIMPVIGFYLQQAVGGRVFSYEYWQKFCEIENVVAIKCASFNRYTTMDVVRAVGNSSRYDKISLYTGNDDNIIADLLADYRIVTGNGPRCLRFSGGLLGHWCIWTRKAVEVFEQVCIARKEGRVPAELLALGPVVTDMNAAVFDARNNFSGCIPGIHEVLRRQGLLENILCLNPDETLSEGQNAELDRVVASYPELVDDDFVKAHLEEWM